MQPLKLTIQGRFWDSFLYEGRLYLFGLDGEITTVNWDSIIRGLKLKKEHELALVCAFLRSDFLYGIDLKLLFLDNEIKNIVIRKFKTLAEKSLEVSSQKLKRHIISTQDNPCFFPHSDIEVYYRTIYVASKDGLMSASCNKRTKYGISSRPEKKWDGPVTGVSANYRALAIAAGDEGLYELSLGYDSGDLNGDEPIKLSGESCNDCSWTYHSIFGSSHESGFLASYRSEQISNFKFSRKFDEIIPAYQIFGSRGFSWGVQDKLCQAVRDGIKVVKYRPWSKDDSYFQEIGIVPLEAWKGEIVSASVASFGVVVEAENAIVIFPSAGPSVTLTGEPTNWRTFPRSKNYENQLHVIYEDRLEIYSFNHDYLVDQESKISGIYTRAGRDKGKRKDSINSLQSMLSS